MKTIIILASIVSIIFNFMAQVIITMDEYQEYQYLKREYAPLQAELRRIKFEN